MTDGLYVEFYAARVLVSREVFYIIKNMLLEYNLMGAYEIL